MEQKQAFAAPVYRAAQKVVPAVAQAGKAFLKPVRQASPALVEQARNIPRLANPKLDRTMDLARRLANTPPGERLRQRPVSNLLKMLTLDGVPGMRRLNQGALGTAVFHAGNAVGDVYRNINSSVENATNQLRSYFDLEGRFKDRFNDSVHGLKRDALVDTFFKVPMRRVFGIGHERQKDYDSLVTEEVGRALKEHLLMQEQKTPSAFDTLWSYRTPSSALAAMSKDKALNEVLGDFPSSAHEAVRHALSFGKVQNGSTALEKSVANRLSWLISGLTPEEKLSLLNTAGQQINR